MITKRILQIVWKQFTQRKLRSILTIIGISIGIIALVSLIILSMALKQGVTAGLDRFGSDVILVAPLAAVGGGPPSGTGEFTDDDVRVVENTPQVLKVYYFASQNLEVSFGREDIRILVRGINLELTPSGGDFADFVDLDLLDGRYLEAGDRNVVNIGYRLAKERFDKEIFVGNRIEIAGKKYTVAGIFEEQGDQGEDNAIFMNIEDIRDLIGDSKAVTAISARIAPGADLEIVNDRIKNRLERSRGEEDFGTTTPQEIREQVGSLLAVVDIVVISVALISLFVGALGITNSLYTSVLQRTKEIGAMKAVGARNSQILSIFIIESCILGFFGGVIGILIGKLIGQAFIFGINTLGFIRLEMYTDINLIIGTMIFCIGLGLIAGIVPAIQASKLKPVDALRHE